MKIQISNGTFMTVPTQQAETIVGVIRGDSLRDIDFPLTPNPRTFTGKANKNYKRMLHTVINEPELFFFKNSSGITVFVSDFKLDDNGVLTLELDPQKDGIVNGGHTYQVIKNFGTHKVSVKMQIVKGLPEENLIDIVESLNLSKRIEAYSLENRRGTFDWYREALGEQASSVCYFEGDTGLIDIRESIGALHVFLYSKSGEKRPLSAYRGSVNVNHQALYKFKKEEYMRQVEGIAKDVHNLHFHIITNQHYVALCEMSHVLGWRRRMRNNEHGLIRSIANLVLLGIAVAGTGIDDGKVYWKQACSTHHLRCKFADAFFSKVFDILVTEDGTISSCCKRESVIEKVVRQAQVTLVQQGATQQMELL